MAEATILSGLVGGLVATVIMTIVMMVVGDDSPPPTALLWSKYVGDGEPEDYMTQGMSLHMLYGVGAGAVLAAVLIAAGVEAVGAFGAAVAAGAVWGFFLFVVGAAFWMNAVLGLDPERRQVIQFFVLHEVYGVVLGAWLALGIV